MSTAYEPSAALPAPHRDDVAALPTWLRRAVEAWGVRRSGSSWVAGILGGVAERYRIDPLLARGLFVALCFVSAGLGLLAYAAAWAVLPDAEGRVQYGRLRRRERADAPVAIAVIGGIGAVNLVLGAGFTLLAPAVGGPGAVLGLGAVAVLVWWLVTRWDADAQRRVGPQAGPQAGPEGGRVGAAPAWYARHRGAEARPAAADEHGFRPDWIDPVTGAWRDEVHSRERRAEARVAAASGRGSTRAGVPLPRLRPARAPHRAEARGVRPALGWAAQALTYVLAALAAAVTLVFALLGGVTPSATLLPVPSLVAALAVVVAAMTAGLLRGRRPGSLAPASGVLVGMAALQLVVGLGLD